jgi:hypothetical protein
MTIECDCGEKYNGDNIPEFCPICECNLHDIPSESLKCFECDELATGVLVIPMLGHKCLCYIHSKEYEEKGYYISYDNWRLAK